MGWEDGQRQGRREVRGGEGGCYGNQPPSALDRTATSPSRPAPCLTSRHTLHTRLQAQQVRYNAEELLGDCTYYFPKWVAGGSRAWRTEWLSHTWGEGSAAGLTSCGVVA